MSAKTPNTEILPWKIINVESSLQGERMRLSTFAYSALGSAIVNRKQIELMYSKMYSESKWFFTN